VARSDGVPVVCPAGLSVVVRMETLHHELWIVSAINAVFGPVAAAILHALGREVPTHGDIIPDYLAIIIFLTLLLTAFSLFVRSRLSVEHPGKLQIVLEDAVTGLLGILDDIVGPKGRRYLPLVGTLGILIWACNLAGLVPGLMAPTSNYNVTLGCAITVWVYYHFQGIKEQGIGPYFKHFAMPPGAPAWIAPIMLPIELISHFSRVLSLSLRLFGNIFGEELVILILASIIPFLVPLPMMLLGLLTGSLQALIFVMLTMIYLGGAVQSEDHGEEHADERHGTRVEPAVQH
jgi:F-type H+-transporting ATPase subunit a